MLDLKQGLAETGIRVRAIRLTPRALSRREGSSVVLLRGAPDSLVDHAVVVTPLRDDAIWVTDPGGVLRGRVPLKVFSKKWTGLAFVVDRQHKVRCVPSWVWRIGLPCLLIGGVFLVGWNVVTQRGRSTRRRSREARAGAWSMGDSLGSALLAAMILSSAAGPCADGADESRDVVKVANPDRNLGVVQAGTRITEEFTLQNTGTTPVVIAAKGNCACSIHVPNPRVPPNGLGRVQLTINPGNAPSIRQAVTVTVQPGNREIRLGVRAEVVGAFYSVPRKLTFGECKPDTELSAILTVRNTVRLGDATGTVEFLRVPEGIRCEFVRRKSRIIGHYVREQSTEFRISVRTGSYGEGMRDELLVALRKGEDKRHLRVPISAWTVSQVKVSPSPVFFLAKRSDTLVRRRCFISLTAASIGKVTRVDVPPRLAGVVRIEQQSDRSSAGTVCLDVFVSPHAVSVRRVKEEIGITIDGIDVRVPLYIVLTGPDSPEQNQH